MRVKFLSTILVGVLMALSLGCAKKVKAPEPPQVAVDRSILGAADVLDLVSTGVNAADDVRKQLNANGQLSDAESASVLNYLKIVTQKNEAARNLLLVAEQGNQQVDIKSALVSVSQAISSLDPTLFGIKNANAQATLKSGLAVLQSAVQVIAATYGGN